MGPPGEREEVAETAAAVVAAINGRDAGALGRLLADDAEVVTGRSVHTGPEVIAAWARKEYDHLTKRYEIDEYRTAGSRVLALGHVQYVWTEGGEVADSTQVALLIEVERGALRRLTVNDDTRTALVEFESGTGA